MTELTAAAPLLPTVQAGSLAVTTPVVTVSTHKSIVSVLEGYATLLEQDLESAWKTHQVAFVAAVAFIIGLIAGTIV